MIENDTTANMAHRSMTGSKSGRRKWLCVESVFDQPDREKNLKKSDELSPF